MGVNIVSNAIYLALSIHRRTPTPTFVSPCKAFIIMNFSYHCEGSLQLLIHPYIHFLSALRLYEFVRNKDVSSGLLTLLWIQDMERRNHNPLLSWPIVRHTSTSTQHLCVILRNAHCLVATKHLPYIKQS